MYLLPAGNLGGHHTFLPRPPHCHLHQGSDPFSTQLRSEGLESVDLVLMGEEPMWSVQLENSPAFFEDQIQNKIPKHKNANNQKTLKKKKNIYIYKLQIPQTTFLLFLEFL